MNNPLSMILFSHLSFSLIIVTLNKALHWAFRVVNLVLELKCTDIEKEMGIEATCPYIAHGENEAELMDDMRKHAKEVHGYTDEDLSDPETIAIMKKHIRTA